MWLNLRERLRDFRVKHLTSSQKIAIIFDHIQEPTFKGSWPQWIRPGKQIKQNFLRWTSSLQNLANKSGACINQPFILFIHHIWGETVLWGTVFITQPSDRMQYFTIFQDKLHSFNIRTINRALLAKPFKNFRKSPLRPAVLTFNKHQICSASCGRCLNEL